MFSLLSLPIITQTQPSTSSSLELLFSQPLDVILFQLLLWFGWIPIAITIFWGFAELWKDHRQGMYTATIKYVLLAIDVPAMTEQTPKALENLFQSLYGGRSSFTWKDRWIGGKLQPIFTFEIISSEGYIQFLIRTQTRFRDVIEAGIYAHYPDVEITEVEDYTKEFPKVYPNEEYDMWGIEATLTKDSMYPIRTYVDFEDKMTQEIKDPLGYVLEQLAKMRPGEHFWIQLLIQPSSQDWKDKGVKRVKEIYGVKEKPKKGQFATFVEFLFSVPFDIVKEASSIDLAALLFGKAPEEAKDLFRVLNISLAEREEAEAIWHKTTKFGHGVKMRYVYVAKKNAFVKGERAAMMKGMMLSYSHLNFNSFGGYLPQIPRDDYFWLKWSYTKKQQTLMKAYKNRSWGIGGEPFWLNAEELATLWHFPAIGIKAPLVKKAEARRGEPPVGLPITFEEETLPGFVTPPTEALVLPFEDTFPSAEGSAMPVGTSRSLMDVIGETLPRPTPPTHKKEKPEDGFVPPNLPV